MHQEVRFIVVMCGLSTGGVIGERKLPPFQNASSSVEELARRFLVSLEKRDRKSLEGLALGREEFKRLIWPDLPASHANTNLTLDYVWSQLELRSRSGLASTFAGYSGQRFEPTKIRFAGGEDAGRGLISYSAYHVFWWIRELKK